MSRLIEIDGNCKHCPCSVRLGNSDYCALSGDPTNYRRGYCSIGEDKEDYDKNVTKELEKVNEDLLSEVADLQDQIKELEAALAIELHLK